MIKICKCCGKEFLPHNKSQLCCSRKCNGFLKRKRDIRICEWCGEEFEINKSSPQKFCNEKCYGAWRSENIRGDKASNWQGGDVSKICVICGKEYNISKSSTEKSRCCSVECKNIWQRESGICKGENNPNWHGGQIVKICSVCGNEFSIPPQSNQKFCSYECMGIWRSKNFTGENASHWKGGEITYICDYCGKEINKYKLQLYNNNFCDKLCYDKWQIESGYNRGENNSLWTGGRNVHEARRRKLGYQPLNDKFPGSHGHHITRTLVIHIPKELHQHISHNLRTGRNMAEINALALQYLNGCYK